MPFSKWMCGRFSSVNTFIHVRRSNQDCKSMIRMIARLFNMLGPFQVQVCAFVCVCVCVCFLTCCSLSWYQKQQRKPADLCFQFGNALLYKILQGLHALHCFVPSFQASNGFARAHTSRNSLASRTLHSAVLSGKLPARLPRLGTTTARLRDRRDQVAMKTMHSARNCLCCTVLLEW